MSADGAHLPESVANHVVTGVPRARASETAGALVARLRASAPENVELILVVEEDGRLAGVLPLARLLALDPSVQVGTAADSAFPVIPAGLDQEHAASTALHHRVDTLVVVDAGGHPLGVMPSQAIMQVLRREHVEDLHRLAGIRHEAAQARHAIEDPPLRRVRHRLPWLLAGLAGSAVATATMAGFEETLRANVALAFFVPAIVYLADAVGTQSEAIAVRGLSLRSLARVHSGLGSVLAGEILTGALIGLALAAFAFPAVLLGFGDARLAAAVACAILAAGCVAAAIGFSLPWAFSRAGIDPALGSGPLATIVQDVLSIVVYFAIARGFGL